MEFSAKKFPCIECRKEVRPRQEAVSCDNCEKWQHRLCIPASSLSRKDYLRAVKEGRDVVWTCKPCKLAADPVLRAYELMRKIRAGASAATTAAPMTRPHRKVLMPARYRSMEPKRPLPVITAAKPTEESFDSSVQHGDASILRALQDESSLSQPLADRSGSGADILDSSQTTTPALESTRASMDLDDGVPPRPSQSPLPPLSPARASSSRPSPGSRPPAASGSPPLAASGSPTQDSLDDLSYNIPEVAVESSMQDPVVDDDVDGPFNLAFKIIKNATIRGKDKLVDTRGYGYILRRSNANSDNWRCDVWNSRVKCGASVVQRGDSFTIRGTHCHPPLVGKDLALERGFQSRCKCLPGRFFSSV